MFICDSKFDNIPFACGYVSQSRIKNARSFLDYLQSKNILTIGIEGIVNRMRFVVDELQGTSVIVSCYVMEWNDRHDKQIEDRQKIKFNWR
jgi:hypothetical protein